MCLQPPDNYTGSAIVVTWLLIKRISSSLVSWGCWVCTVLQGRLQCQPGNDSCEMDVYNCHLRGVQLALLGAVVALGFICRVASNLNFKWVTCKADLRSESRSTAYYEVTCFICKMSCTVSTMTITYILFIWVQILKMNSKECRLILAHSYCVYLYFCWATCLWNHVLLSHQRCSIEFGLLAY